VDKLITVIIVISLIGMISGCLSIGNEIDVGFRDGSHKTYKNIDDWTVINDGILSDTVDLHTVYGETIRLHYVTSIESIN